jgi:hypothetical protein
LNLTRKAAAKRMGLDPDSLENWEKNRTRIAVRFYPSLIAFLGYNPLPEPRTRGEAVRRQRVTLGLSVGRLGTLERVYPTTVCRLESDRSKMAKRPISAVLRVLGMSQRHEQQ